MSYERIDAIIDELGNLELTINKLKLEYKESKYSQEILSNIIEANKTSNSLIEEWLLISRHLRNSR